MAVTIFQRRQRHVRLTDISFTLVLMGVVPEVEGLRTFFMGAVLRRRGPDGLQR